MLFREVSMKDKDKVIDFERYRQDKLFEDELLENIAYMTDEEIDDFYDHIAFGAEDDDNAGSGTDLLREMRFLEELESEAYLQWAVLPEKSWANEECRPYLSVKMDLAMLYKQNGLYQKALEHLMQIYKADTNDSLGVRYEILSLYVLRSDYDMAEAFFKIRKEHETDALMKIPMLIAAILSGHNAMAERLIEELCEQVDGFLEFCLQEVFPMQRLLEAGALEAYQPNSSDSLYIGLYNVLPLLLTASSYIQAYLNAYFREDEVYLEELGILTSAQLMNLTDYGIRTVSDMAEFTEAQLLTIPKIGKVTLKKLEAARVVFSSK